MQGATDIYATKMPVRDRAFWSKWLGVNLALQKSRAGFRRLVRKSAHGVGGLIEHADDRKLINSSVQATLSQACDSRHIKPSLDSLNAVSRR
jgi:hypothetical protein